MRKHFSQMTQQEIGTVRERIRSTDWTQVYEHAIRACEARMVRIDEVVEALKSGILIEVHNDRPGDIRAVVRADVAGRSVCAAVSLVKNAIVTVWVNDCNDNHRTLDRSKYTWNADIKSVIQSI